ncbi:tubulin-tyrosine ligase family protein, putative [Ichthyophthirius multifiliis]|uniref:Tubulin-tyrosine ligase family protein, putative n=1 Tax=Ichthyophthirius multifiliis TaxID=5932 RepID=G0QVI6_ICHMU|nr:tubulin-tyrosine ligase family protein, putative [Ichthyophthirius multifiliis]EGR30772.1 tubulin-tyrosine ligase family protein, putative [Ichthyophthirius multifiliis]|eukprot:XP_004032359.1 tubulin-tyrosine ligase family protein, putative [Ichthyophthirius multifiliis]
MIQNFGKKIKTYQRNKSKHQNKYVYIYIYIYIYIYLYIIYIFNVYFFYKNYKQNFFYQKFILFQHIKFIQYLFYIQVFIVTGGYGDIKKSLRKRGWIENPDNKSQCYDFKWCLFTKEIDFETLKDFQIVNHFQKSTCFTTKVGLCKNIRNLVWHDNVDIDTFYPRCYDLNDVDDFYNFQIEFKTSKAESILKKYMRMYFCEMDLQNIQKQAVIAFNVCERKIKGFNDTIDEKSPFKFVSKKEWNILSSDELNEEKLAQKKHEQWLQKIEGKKKKKIKKQKKLEKQKSLKDERNSEDEQQNSEEEEAKMDSFTLKVHQLLKKYQQKYPQYCINGEDNIWIIKPAGLSRGRGITCYNNLIEILDHMKSKESQWIIQKYIENPLIVKKRKFDIRVWVLLTDWNPLTIWEYTNCYVRFSCDDYDTNNLQNKFTHLTNNMISRLKEREEKDEIYDKGNMYTKEEFINYLLEKEKTMFF